MKIISTVEERKQVSATRIAEIRMRFRKARVFLNPMNTLIQLGFSVKSRRRGTAIGYAMSHTLQYAVEGSYPNIEINPAMVVVSQGALPGLRRVQVERKTDKIVVTWEGGDENALVEMSANDDRVIICAYNPELGVACINEGDELRQDNRLQLKLPVVLKGQTVHLYLFLHDRDKKTLSTSKYLGGF